MNLGGQLIAGEARFEERDQIFGVDPRCGLAQLDHGDRHGPESLVVAAEHRRGAHRLVAFKRGANVVGQHLEPTADDGVIAAPEDVDEAVGVDAGQVGRAHVSLIADLRRTDLEHPFGVDAEHLAGVGVDDAQVISGLDPADAALLGVPEPLVIRHVPPGHRSAELGGRIGDENPGSVAGEELVAIGGVERRGATHDRTQTRQIGGVGVRLEDHAQRGGNEGGGRRAVTTDQIDPPVDVESFEHRERAPVVHRQQHAKQPTEMGERRVHQRNPLPKLWGRVFAVGTAFLVVLRPDEDVFKGGVAQVDALGRSRRAARQHAYGDSGS